jgi:phosphoglycerate dehydrogenase-like enzyme
LLAHAKNLRQMQEDQRAHRWERTCAGELAGQTLAVIGAGKVGANVGRIGRAFGMRTIGVLARPTPERARELGLDRVAGQDELHAVLAEADAVVLATPHTPATEGMIDRAAIAAMKRGIVLVNIARGAVIDEAAMIAALRDGRIAYAGLDVAAVEPLPPDSPLWDMPNVMVSPHSASTAPSENAKIAAIFCANLTHFLAGRRDKLINVLDKHRMY